MYKIFDVFEAVIESAKSDFPGIRAMPYEE